MSLFLIALFPSVSFRFATAALASAMDIPRVTLTEDQFRWDHNQDAMATEKLAEGIRNFAIDGSKLETKLAELLK